MNAKLAKKLRRKTREACAKSGIQSDTTYNVKPNRVRFEGAFHTLGVHGAQFRQMSQQKRDQHDEKRDLRRALRAGVAVNYILSDVFGINLVKPQAVLGNCERGVYQRTKRALS